MNNAKWLKIERYRKSIEALEKMKSIYEEEVYLFGGYYTDMIAEIDLQIADCKTFIENIKKSGRKENK